TACNPFKVTERLAEIAGLNTRHGEAAMRSKPSSLAGSRMNSIPEAQSNVDLKVLDKLVSSLLEQHAAGAGSKNSATSNLESGNRTSLSGQRKASKKLNRWGRLSRSVNSFKRGDGGGRDYASGNFTQLQDRSEAQPSLAQHTPNMPTIMESSAGSASPNNAQQIQHNPWTASLERTPRAVRNMLHNIGQAVRQEDQLNLNQNYVG
ncbi:GH11076, partial [Drosophila grimshawi]